VAASVSEWTSAYPQPKKGTRPSERLNISHSNF